MLVFSIERTMIKSGKVTQKLSCCKKFLLSSRCHPICNMSSSFCLSENNEVSMDYDTSNYWQINSNESAGSRFIDLEQGYA